MNSCNFVGKLIKDPELRYTANGTATCSFTLSVYNPFAQGEYKSDLINFISWKGTAEAIANYLKKGSMCSVESRYSPRSYENNEGRKVWLHEFTANNVRFLDRQGQQQEQSYDGSQKKDPFVDDGEPVDISNDDLPF